MKNNQIGFLKLSVMVGAGLMLCVLNSCKHDGISADQMPPISFTNVQPIFQNYCGNCHNGSGKDGRMDYTTYTGILKEITPGNASKSKAYQAMTSTFQIMPPNIAMPTNKRTMIRLWIDQGAKPE